MYELNLELRNKSKTQARQSKNYSKNYHKLLVISIAHGKKITLRNYQKHALINKRDVLEINKTHEITSKIQEFETQILYQTTHGQRRLGLKNQV
jgi:hypothetical protein